MLVAITGNFCSGKSSLAEIFRAKGFKTFDSDKIVAELYARKKTALKVKKICHEAVANSGKVNKKILAEKVFSSASKLRRLNRLMHPLVKKEILLLSKKFRKSRKPVFVEVPLLFEARMQSLFDSVILVKCARKTALERARRKGFTSRQFARIVSLQQPWKKNSKKAGFVFGSDNGLKGLGKAAEKGLAGI